jgi:cytochrome P450
MDFDLDDPALLLRDDVVADPRPLYDVLRRRAPVWRIPGQESYLVSDPALVREAVGRTTEFSSNLVSLLHRDADGRLVSFPMIPLGDPLHVLATADPPAHTRHRKLLQPHLNPAAVAPLEPTLRRIVDEQLDPLLAAGRGDVVAALADPVPALAICYLLGLPPDDASRLLPLVTDLSPLLDGVTDPDGMSHAANATIGLYDYAQARLDDARSRATGECSGLLAVLVDGIGSGALTVDEARAILLQFFTAGTETTSSLVASAIEILARRADLQARLRRHPEGIPDMLEDVLREDGPFQFHYRWTTTDATLGDVRVPANSHVLLMWAAANRPSPEQPGRPREDPDAAGAGSHFAFGRGIHFCIGAPLARLESRLVLERLLARTSSLALDSERPPVRRPSVFLRRHASLPVVVGARRSASDTAAG